MYRAFILTKFSIATKDGVCLHLIELRRHCWVLHWVRAVCVKTFINLSFLDGHIHVASGIRCLLRAIYRYTLDSPCTAEIFPTWNWFPAWKIRANELLGLPLALWYLISYATSLGTLLFLHCFDGSGKRIVTVFKRNLLSHIVRVTATAATDFNKVIFFIAPNIENITTKINLVFLYAWNILTTVQFRIGNTFNSPVAVILATHIIGKLLLALHIDDYTALGNGWLKLYCGRFHHIGKTCRCTIESSLGYILVFSHNFRCSSHSTISFFRCIRSCWCGCIGCTCSRICAICDRIHGLRCFRCSICCTYCICHSILRWFGQQLYWRTHYFLTS